MNPGKEFLTLTFDDTGEVLSVRFEDEIIPLDKPTGSAFRNDPPIGELKGIKSLGEMYFYYDRENNTTKRCYHNGCTTYCKRSVERQR